MVDNAGSADGATAAFPGVLSLPIQGCAGRLGDVAVGVGGEFYGVGDCKIVQEITSLYEESRRRNHYNEKKKNPVCGRIVEGGFLCRTMKNRK